MQDTGFSRTTGHGLIAFRTVEDAVRGVEAIQRDPRRTSISPALAASRVERGHRSIARTKWASRRVCAPREGETAYMAMVQH